MADAPQTLSFVPETVHKRDVFSETISGHLAEDPGFKVVLRKLDGVPWWARPIARFLARREVRGLRAVKGIEGVPQLLRADREGLLRSWSHGTPLQLAKPAQAAWYRDAKRLLRERAFANIHVIEAANAPFSGDHDFSSAGVMERRERGRTAAEIWLKANRTLTAA